MSDEQSDDHPRVPAMPDDKSRRRVITDTAVEAGTAAIPFVGGSLAVIIANAFSRSYENRLRDWMEQLAEVVQELCDSDGVDVEDLAGNDVFLDAVATATRIAEKNGSHVKRAALRNALLHIGGDHEIGEDKGLIYLRCIDELTETHMRILAFFDNPPAAVEAAGAHWPILMMGGISSILDLALPDIASSEPLLNAVIGDLVQRRFVDSPGLHTVMTDNGLRASRTTSMGREFMAFVSTPSE